MGAARAVQLKADQVPFDGLAIAQALAAELKAAATISSCSAAWPPTRRAAPSGR